MNRNGTLPFFHNRLLTPFVGEGKRPYASFDSNSKENSQPPYRSVFRITMIRRKSRREIEGKIASIIHTCRSRVAQVHKHTSTDTHPRQQEYDEFDNGVCRANEICQPRNFVRVKVPSLPSCRFARLPTPTGGSNGASPGVTISNNHTRRGAIISQSSLLSFGGAIKNNERPA